MKYLLKYTQKIKNIKHPKKLINILLSNNIN